MELTALPPTTVEFSLQVPVVSLTKEGSDSLDNKIPGRLSPSRPCPSAIVYGFAEKTRIEMYIESLKKIVESFHDSLGRISPRFPILFGVYPRGACGNASEMLEHYLRSVHLIETDYWSGEIYTPHFQSHAWLKHESILIDLTCCQFDDCPFQCPYVECDESWHSKWRAKPKLIAGGMCHWGQAYKEVLKDLAF